jgi:hypothetical protein
MWSYYSRIYQIEDEMTETDDLKKKMIIGDKYKDYCYSCYKTTLHKLISFNKFDNPVYECLSCGNFSVDEVNEQDGL